ncbi:MAG: thioredoxin family protein [Bdellovibrionaceae bacterium]|nr:thioredoxin family protein [Pseudobdellovibrionaceae bacterium]MBX3032329.1 thioredoxin family protein [Pseudobdellovibrionaceae bacterium]
MALMHTPAPSFGAPCPDFSLPATDGKILSAKDLRNGRPFLVMFICNHCPYVKAVEDRLIALGHEARERGMNVVAISSNDAEHYPADSFPNMKKLAEEKNYSFPYLYDESQRVAKDFGAVCTPDFFLYDSRGLLAYRGRLDDSWKDPAGVTKRELWTAMETLLAGRPLDSEQIPSMGCSMKWRT